MAKDRTSEVEEAKKEIDFSSKKYTVTFDTNFGKINLELYQDRAPKHCEHIVALSKIGYYDGLKFHRVVPGFVIQGGCPDGTGTGGPGYQVDAEFNDIPHEAGILSMARTQDPNSAGSQFFLCLDKVPYLDNQYTVFGKTADDSSLEVVKKIGATETGAGDKPVDDVVISNATITEALH